MKRMIVMLCLVATTSGCSTIVRGSRQDVEVKTNPPGAMARINTQQCFTPCTLQNVSRKAESVIITHEGSEKSYTLDRSFNFFTTIVGNWWNYVWPGVIVDAMSGAMFSIEDINLELAPALKTEAKAPST